MSNWPSQAIGGAGEHEPKGNKLKKIFHRLYLKNEALYGPESIFIIVKTNKYHIVTCLNFYLLKQSDIDSV